MRQSGSRTTNVAVEHLVHRVFIERRIAHSRPDRLLLSRYSPRPWRFLAALVHAGRGKNHGSPRGCLEPPTKAPGEVRPRPSSAGRPTPGKLRPVIGSPTARNPPGGARSLSRKVEEQPVAIGDPGVGQEPRSSRDSPPRPHLPGGDVAEGLLRTQRRLLPFDWARLVRRAKYPRASSRNGSSPCLTRGSRAEGRSCCSSDEIQHPVRRRGRPRGKCHVTPATFSSRWRRPRRTGTESARTHPHEYRNPHREGTPRWNARFQPIIVPEPLRVPRTRSRSLRVPCASARRGPSNGVKIHETVRSWPRRDRFFIHLYISDRLFFLAMTRRSTALCD